MALEVFLLFFFFLTSVVKVHNWSKVMFSGPSKYIKNSSGLCSLFASLFLDRSASICAEDSSSDYCAAGDYREGPLWRGVEGKVERRRRGSEDFLLSRRTLLVS